jgi:hypothetical protein
MYIESALATNVGHFQHLIIFGSMLRYCDGDAVISGWNNDRPYVCFLHFL